MKTIKPSTLGENSQLSNPLIFFSIDCGHDWLSHSINTCTIGTREVSDNVMKHNVSVRF